MLLAAAAEGLGTAFHIPVSDEAEMIKKIVGAPEDYEFTCLLTIGYPAENAFLPKQKEIDIEDRIHKNIWYFVSIIFIDCSYIIYVYLEHYNRWQCNAYFQ